MKRILFLTLCLVCGLEGSAQYWSKESAVLAGQICEPRFEGGGSVTFMRWVLDKLVFPEELYDTNQHVRVELGFTVGKDGMLRSVKALNPVDKVYANEVLRVVKLSPAWTPAHRNGEEVMYKCRVSLDFRLCRAVGPDGLVRSVAEDNTIYGSPDVAPAFAGGGTERVEEWLTGCVPAALIPDTMRVRMLAGCVVERSGAVSHVSVEKGGVPSDSLRYAVEHVLARMPLWQPGQTEGAAVRSYVSMWLALGRGTTYEDDLGTGTEIRDIAVRMPQFGNGSPGAFTVWLRNQIDYPDWALIQDLEGQVVVDVVIEKDGSLTYLQTLRAFHPFFEEEVLRVLKSSPKWTPGVTNGVPVRVRCSIPVEFRVAVTAPEVPGVGLLPLGVQ